MVPGHEAGAHVVLSFIPPVACVKILLNVARIIWRLHSTRKAWLLFDLFPHRLIKLMAGRPRGRPPHVGALRAGHALGSHPLRPAAYAAHRQGAVCLINYE